VTPDELDRILSSDDFLEPSSGFARGVMDAVRSQSTEPPPIPFPWPRFVVGLAACLTLAAVGAALLARAAPLLQVLMAPLAPAGPELGYATLAVVGSLALASLPSAFFRR